MCAICEISRGASCAIFIKSDRRRNVNARSIDYLIGSKWEFATMNIFNLYTHTHTRTHTYIHIRTPTYIDEGRQLRAFRRNVMVIARVNWIICIDENVNWKCNPEHNARIDKCMHIPNGVLIKHRHEKKNSKANFRVTDVTDDATSRRHARRARIWKR